MFKNYIDEFIAITDFLIKTGKYKKTLRFLIVPKNEVEKLLDKNKFDTSRNKLKTWKALNWIDTEDERVTKRIYVDGRYIACIKIYLQVFETMKNLNEK